MPTYVPSANTAASASGVGAHQLTVKQYNAALFYQILGKSAMGDLGVLEDVPPSPQQMKDLVEGKLSYADSPRMAPGVRIMNMGKGEGDEVSVDIVHPSNGRPTMGDRQLSGRLSTTSFASMPIKLDQMRLGHDPGGRMTQQRTKHDLRAIGRTQVLDQSVRTIEQVKLCHVAGDRGQDQQLAWMIPDEDDAEFSEILVNPLRRPTYNRHFYAAGATSMAELDSTCILTLYDIARMRALIDEMEAPFLPCKLPGDKQSERNPLYVLRVTPRQWHHLQTYHDGRGKDWQTFMANARNRGADNPLFTGDEVGIWRGILVYKGLLPVCFYAGSTVTVASSAEHYAETTVTVPEFTGHAEDRVDRALLFGAQAWASLYGQDSRSGMPTRWHEEDVDHGNRTEYSLAGMCGHAKLTFRTKSGVDTDQGVIAYDTFAPIAAGSPVEINVV